jgi:hypothetical protein
VSSWYTPITRRVIGVSCSASSDGGRRTLWGCSTVISLVIWWWGSSPVSVPGCFGVHKVCSVGLWWETVVLFLGRWYGGWEEKSSWSMEFKLCFTICLSFKQPKFMYLCSVSYFWGWSEPYKGYISEHYRCFLRRVLRDVDLNRPTTRRRRHVELPNPATNIPVLVTSVSCPSVYSHIQRNHHSRDCWTSIGTLYQVWVGGRRDDGSDSKWGEHLRTTGPGPRTTMDLTCVT